LASGAKGRRFDSCRAHTEPLPKTLAEIAIDGGLVKRVDAARAGRLAETQGQPLIVVLVRELGVDEVALIGAMRRQMRVPLLDPSAIHVDAEALRLVPKDVCLRLHVLPTTVGIDAAGARVMRIAMADPTDTSAIAELEQISECELEISALTLSAVEGWIERAYRGLTTEVVRHKPLPDRPVAAPAWPTTRSSTTEPSSLLSDPEISETAQIAAPRLLGGERELELERRVFALTQLLLAKGVFTEAELESQLQLLLGPGLPPKT
jgi:Type II secretion system (T2SS), protein E, N-terminal domain